jgi:hypothetical protein
MNLKIIPVGKEYNREHLDVVGRIITGAYGSEIVTYYTITDLYPATLEKFEFRPLDREHKRSVLAEKSGRIGRTYGLPFLALLPVGALGGYGLENTGAFVFTENENIERRITRIGKMAAHELGHLLGLSHHYDEEMDPLDRCLMDISISDYFSPEYAQAINSREPRFCGSCRKILRTRVNFGQSTPTESFKYPKSNKLSLRNSKYRLTT